MVVVVVVVVSGIIFVKRPFSAAGQARAVCGGGLGWAGKSRCEGREGRRDETRREARATYALRSGGRGEVRST